MSSSYVFSSPILLLFGIESLSIAAYGFPFCSVEYDVISATLSNGAFDCSPLRISAICAFDKSNFTYIVLWFSPVPAISPSFVVSIVILLYLLFTFSTLDTLSSPVTSPVVSSIAVPTFIPVFSYLASK